MNRLVIILGGVLFLSLAGNLFMAGYMIGGKAGGVSATAKQDDRADWKKRDDELRKKLSDSDRKVFEEIKSANQGKIQDLKKTLDAARERVEEAEHAEPADKAALEQAIRGEAAARAQFLGTIRAMRKDIAEKISPEGRSAMEKLRPPKKDREGKRGERRRGEFMERWRERPGRGSEERRPVRGSAAPPPHEDGEGYGNHRPPPPKADCGGCEVPGDSSGEPQESEEFEEFDEIDEFDEFYEQPAP